jgi:hypothetical protein
MLWDGSFLETHLIIFNIIAIVSHKRLLIAATIKEEKFTAILIPIDLEFQVIDEFKRVFGLKSIGTHNISCNVPTLGEGCYTLCHYSDYIYPLNVMHPGDMTELLRCDIRNIYVFREMCGVHSSYDRNVFIRKDETRLVAVSMSEKNTTPFDDYSIVTGVMLTKYFQKESLDEVLVRLIGITNVSQITEKIFNLEKKLVQTSNRMCVNKDQMIHDIIKRVRSRILNAVSL